MKITYTCEWCGESVTKIRSPKNMPKAPRFCSQKCNGESKRGAGNGRSVSHEFDCESCGAHVRAYRSPSAGSPRFCSVKCIGVAQSGDRNPAYSSGRHVDDAGYVRVMVPGFGRYEFEHRIVAARSIGRALMPGEVVHHINHIKTDNRPENLQVLPSQSEHMKLHHAEGAILNV